MVGSDAKMISVGEIHSSVEESVGEMGRVGYILWKMTSESRR